MIKKLYFRFMFCTLIIMLFGCSSNLSDEDIRKAAVALLTEQAISEQVVSPQILTVEPSPSATFTATPVLLSLGNMREIVLQISDLRSGYQLDDEQELSLDVFRAEGANRSLAYFETVQPFTGLDVIYTRATLANFAGLRARIVIFPTEQVASEYLNIHATLFGENEPELEVISFVSLADESKAFFTQVTDEGFTLDGYFVVMRRRNVVVAVNYSTLAGLADLDELEEYSHIVETRLMESVP